MSPLRNEKGVALVTALMLTMISLGIIMALMYMVMQSTKMSAMSKFYKNSLEASYGGVEGMAKDLLPHIFGNISTTSLAVMKTKYSNVELDFQVSDACMKQKLTMTRENWTACSADQKSVIVDLIRVAPDLSFVLRGLPGQPGYKVFSKIVDTTVGNTDAGGNVIAEAAGFSGGEDGGPFVSGASGVSYNPKGVSGSSGGGGGIGIKHIPYLFKFEVQGERAVHAKERANLSVLYAY